MKNLFIGILTILFVNSAFASDAVFHCEATMGGKKLALSPNTTFQELNPGQCMIASPDSNRYTVEVTFACDIPESNRDLAIIVRDLKTNMQFTSEGALSAKDTYEINTVFSASSILTLKCGLN